MTVYSYNGPKLLHAFCIGPDIYFCFFYSADGLLRIYSTSSLLAEACGRLLELLRRHSQFVGSDMSADTCVKSGVRLRGGAH